MKSSQKAEGVMTSNLMIMDQEETEEIKEQEDEVGSARVPNNLSLKFVILGRAFSGKKTIAKQL